MSANTMLEEAAATERRDKSERRAKSERRQKSESIGIERRAAPERRNKVERRRQIDPTTCERDYTDDEIEFMKAVDKYRRENGRPFPTWSEILEVVRALGYQKFQNPVDAPPMITGV